DVMDALPDDARDRHRAHESHHHNALAFHEEENFERPTSNVQHRTKNIGGWALSVGRWALERLTLGNVSRSPPDFLRRLCSVRRFWSRLIPLRQLSSHRW